MIFASEKENESLTYAKLLFTLDICSIIKSYDQGWFLHRAGRHLGRSGWMRLDSNSKSSSKLSSQPSAKRWSLSIKAKLKVVIISHLALTTSCSLSFYIYYAKSDYDNDCDNHTEGDDDNDIYTISTLQQLLWKSLWQSHYTWMWSCLW